MDTLWLVLFIAWLAFCVGVGKLLGWRSTPKK